MNNKNTDFKDWMRETFTEDEVWDIAGGGIEGGVHDLIYYSDTVRIFEEFKEEIFDALVEDAESGGYRNIYDMMKDFNPGHMPGGYNQFANQLTWYMAERTARELLDME